MDDLLEHKRQREKKKEKRRQERERDEAASNAEFADIIRICNLARTAAGAPGVPLRRRPVR